MKITKFHVTCIDQNLSNSIYEFLINHRLMLQILLFPIKLSSTKKLSFTSSSNISVTVYKNGSLKQLSI